jgi:lipoprotein-anchoring transpeptidase ErfK/SrfK
MIGSTRLGKRIAVAGLALLAAACTIEDASDKRAADSAAAVEGTQTAASPGAIGTPQMGGVPGAGLTDSATAAGMSAGAVSASGAPVTDSGAAGTPSTGNLSPDSVDVGRTNKTALLPLASTRIEVDVAKKQLYVFDGDKRVGSYRVAVGSKDWPTQTGEWSITQVVWNPEWIPPEDESWAKEEKPKKPGEADNPLGRAQLIYDPPRTIHGTNDPASIGKAVSHGSIRMANADVTRLARQLMDVTGVQKDEAWYRQVQQNRTEKVAVDLPQRVAIRVY